MLPRSRYAALQRRWLVILVNSKPSLLNLLPACPPAYCQPHSINQLVRYSALSVNLKLSGDSGMQVEFTLYTNSPELYSTLYFRNICNKNRKYKNKHKQNEMTHMYVMRAISLKWPSGLSAYTIYAQISANHFTTQHCIAI